MNLRLLAMSVLMISMVSCGDITPASSSSNETEFPRICSEDFLNDSFDLASSEEDAYSELQYSRTVGSDRSYINLSRELRNLETKMREFEEYSNVNCYYILDGKKKFKHGKDICNRSAETIAKIRSYLNAVGRL